MELDTDEFYQNLVRDFPTLVEGYDEGVEEIDLDGTEYAVELEDPSQHILSRLSSGDARTEANIYREDVRAAGPVGIIRYHPDSKTTELAVTELGLELDLSDALHRAYLAFLTNEGYDYSRAGTILNLE